MRPNTSDPKIAAARPIKASTLKDNNRAGAKGNHKNSSSGCPCIFYREVKVLRQSLRTFDSVFLARLSTLSGTGALEKRRACTDYFQPRQPYHHHLLTADLPNLIPKQNFLLHSLTSTLNPYRSRPTDFTCASTLMSAGSRVVLCR
jgi:hypothetical protein